MLYHICYELLSPEFHVLNVFRYQTFRAMLAFFLSLTFVLILQPRFIRFVRDRKVGQPIREDGPQSHLPKQGTPTMGGLVLVIAVIASALLLADLTNLYVWVVVGLTTSYAALGFWDDYRKVILKNSKGVSARTKLLWQFVCAFVAVVVLVAFAPGFTTTVAMPFFKNADLDLGYWYILFAMFVIVGASNAVNLTDGLDGLVIGPTMTTAFAYGVSAYVTGHAQIAQYLQIPFVSGAGELSIVCGAMIAGGLGFLWYNSFPAQVFMGDVGALAIGGTIGMLALITKQEIVLLICGGIFVVEALSVILQVASFKLTGRRIFKMAPLHHHYELLGLSEPKIIVRAWIISIVLAVVSLATLKLR